MALRYMRRDHIGGQQDGKCMGSARSWAVRASGNDPNVEYFFAPSGVMGFGSAAQNFG